MQAVAARSRSPARSRGGTTRAPPAAKGAKPAATGLPRYLQRGPRGEALPPGMQAEMSQRLGTPMDAVRVHTGPQAAASARAMGASAYTHGNEVVFGAGAYDPQSAPGRSLLAHELTHVAQQRRAGMATGDATQRSGVADGGARGTGKSDLAAEREATLNAQRVHTGATLTAVERPPTGMQRSEAEAPGMLDSFTGAVSDVAGAGIDAVGAVADAGAEAVGSLAMRAVREVAPDLVPVIERGPVAMLRDLVSEALDGLAAGLNALDPSGALGAMLNVFTGLVQRAGDIAAALVSGDCQPLLDAIDQMKTFVTEVAGEAWDRLTEFLQPVGDFFTDLWSGYGAPAIDWLQRKAGAVWGRVDQFGTDIWNWTAPVRNLVGDAWGWVKERLFGPEEAGSGDSSGGIFGWISGKAGEAWDWVKAQTAPAWQPIADTAQRVAEMLPPPWMRNFGQQMQAMSADLGETAAAMEGGEGVAENRDTLASVLPSVTRVIGTVRGVIIEAGGWVSTKVGAFGGAISAVMGQLRSSSILAMLANALGWLEGAALQLVSWANEKVAGLFDWLLQGFDALTPFIEHAAGVVRRLIGVVGDLMSLPRLILSSVWEAIPCCIREPIKNFVFNQILARIPVFGQFFSDPTLWPRVQATAMRILRQVFVDGDLAGAAWAFFQSVLRVLGLPPELVAQVLAKAAAAIGDILTDPVGFLVNLLSAMRAGFGRFFDNIGTHLLNGVSGWLFSQAEHAGITPPTDFSIGSIFGFVLQVLGITVDHIFERLALKLDAATVRRMRQILNVATGAWRFISILVNDGPAALWVEIQSQLANLWERVLDGVIGWVTDAVIGRATRWLMGLLDVTGIMPVINTLVAVYNAIESFMQYLREMLEIVSRVLDGVLDIAHGQIDGAAGFLEDALDRSLPVAIGFLANQFGLGSVGERMHELLESVRETVDSAIDWLIDQGIALGQAFIAMARRGAAAVRDAAGAVAQWWRRRFAFTTDSGEPHEIYVEGEGEEGELMVASTPQRYPDFLATLPASDERTTAQQKYRRLQQLRRRARSLGSATPPSGGGGALTDPLTSNDPQLVSAAIVSLIEEIANLTKRLMPAGGGAATAPVFGSTTAQGWARSAQIDRLNTQRSHWPVRGGEPSVTSARWQRLAKRRTDGNAGDYLYIKGHLLNHNLDGPGNIWENLAPITQDANNRGGASMLHRFENAVKTAVDGGGSARNFRVTMEYGRGDRNAALREIDDEVAAARGNRRRELETIRGVVDEEQYIPSRIHCRAEILNGSGRRVSNLDVPVANTITMRWRNYTVEP